MAALTPSDYGALRRRLYRAGEGKEELKALPNLPSETQLLACFQAIEDRLTAGAVLAKGDIEAILGRSITVAAMRKFTKTWLMRKFDQGG